ncbi:MAG: preprotein translocase subunit YajC [Clostridia bacterium]|nr:preprotein translocase subunit YajC [Clostridia bacterium]MBO5299470.1 preprotein translocase subunit YajC [Clostridia bacterium]MBQ4629286.1 preprotein translocase subunit YajC [Clostridia bacterium]
MLVSFLPFILIIVAFYFFLIRPQRKQEKETQKMRNSIEIGDQITTIGGITGVVRQIKDEDTYIIETGADKNRISIKKWAIQSKDTISDS